MLSINKADSELAWPQALSSRKTTATGQKFYLHDLPSWLKLRLIALSEK